MVNFQNIFFTFQNLKPFKTYCKSLSLQLVPPKEADNDNKICKYMKIGRQRWRSLPWLWEKMSVQRSCAPSDLRGGSWHSWCGSAAGSVLTVRVREGRANAACMSANSSTLAGLLFNFRISSPARRPEHTQSHAKAQIQLVSSLNLQMHWALHKNKFLNDLKTF